MGTQKKSFLILALILVLMPLALNAQDQNPVSFKFNLGVGLDSFTEGTTSVTYQKVTVSPDLAIGKFGIGIDVTIHYRFEAGAFIPRVEGDWVPLAAEQNDGMSWLSLYLSKFKYIRYGLKNEPLFLKLGSIDDALIGNGFIMTNYSNTMSLPQKRIFGFTFDLDGKLFDFPLIGMESFINDVTKPEVMGARLFFRPLCFLELPILNEMEVGVPFIVDRKPYFTDASAALLGINTANAIAYFSGLDVMFPILGGNPIIALAAFADLGTYKFKSLGGMLGFGGTLITLFNYGAQIRFIGDGFIPFYFDRTYDLVKEAKYALIENGNPKGYTGWYGMLGTNLLNGAIVFNMSIEGPFGTVDSNPDNFSNYPRIQGILQVMEGLVPYFSGEITYDKMFIRTPADVFPNFFVNSVIMARINYKTGPAILSLYYRVKYVAGSWSTEASSGLETMIQF